MIKKRITYTDYNGLERTEEFYFNLTHAEIAEMELTTEGGLLEMLQRIVDAKDQASIIANMKRIILSSYGKKTPDGKSFLKSPEIVAAFEHSEPYSILFMELATNDKAASEFIKGIIPKKTASSANVQAPAIAPVGDATTQS